MPNPPHDPDDIPDKVMVALALPAVVLVLVLVAYWATFGLKFADDHERWGQFGDLLGGVLNPVVGSLTLGAAAWAVLYSKKALEEARRTTRSDRVFELYKLWTSADMFACRMDAWNFLREECGIPADGNCAPVSMSAFRRDAKTRPRYLNVQRVYNFIADLSALWGTDLVDDELLRRLFRKHLLDWLYIRRGIQFRQPGLNPQVDAEQDWFTRGAEDLLRRVEAAPPA